MKLFSKLDLGNLSLPNRIVMAPMTRNRAVGTIQSPMAIEHYSLRAAAGLIIGEATQVSARGQGYADTPGLHNATQVAAWQPVTDAVHAAGGRIFAQLVHVGRLSHSDYHGQLPIAPSAIAAPGFVRTPGGLKEYQVPEVPSTSAVADLVAEFAAAARLAQTAGFDGIDLHAANGFLIDQFLQSGTNQRHDRYGGSVVNRLRFALEVVEAVVGIWGPDRVGVTISPGGNHKGISDSQPAETFSQLATALNQFPLAYLHVLEQPVGDLSPTQWLRPMYRGRLMTSEGYTRDSAEAALQANQADLVAFGRAFTANPDLVAKMRADEILSLANPSTFYKGGAEGYLENLSLKWQSGL